MERQVQDRVPKAVFALPSPSQCLAWGHTCQLGIGDVQGGCGDLGVGSSSSLAGAKDKNFDFSCLLTGDPLGLHQSWPGVAHQLPQTWLCHQTWSHLPIPRTVCGAASFLWGFRKGVCTGSCSESLCLRQGLPDWGELGLLFLGVPEPGSMVGRRDQSRQRGWRWGKSPAASDRKSWVLPLLFSFFLFPYLKEKKISKQPQNSQGHLKKPNKALWQRPHSMPGACSPELGAS